MWPVVGMFAFFGLIIFVVVQEEFFSEHAAWLRRRNRDLKLLQRQIKENPDILLECEPLLSKPGCVVGYVYKVDRPGSFDLAGIYTVNGELIDGMVNWSALRSTENYYKNRSGTGS